MRIGRVIGTIVSPVQHPSYEGRKLLAIRPLDPDGSEADDRMFVAVDRAQAGVGDLVLVLADGSSTRDVLGEADAPIRCAVVGVIDEIAVEGKRLFPRDQ